MSLVIDASGKPKQVPAGYMLQPGEMMQIPLMMRDAAPAGGRIMTDSDESRQLRDAADAARDSYIDRLGSAYKGDRANSASLPPAIYDALPIKHRSTLPRAIGAVHDAKASGNAVALRHAVDDLRRTAAGLSPMPGSMTTDAESAIERARQWCEALCDSVSGR